MVDEIQKQKMTLYEQTIENQKAQMQEKLMRSFKTDRYRQLHGK